MDVVGARGRTHEDDGLPLGAAPLRLVGVDDADPAGDARARRPISTAMESLNVSNAAAIALYAVATRESEE